MIIYEKPLSLLLNKKVKITRINDITICYKFGNRLVRTISINSLRSIIEIYWEKLVRVSASLLTVKQRAKNNRDFFSIIYYILKE